MHVERWIGSNFEQLLSRPVEGAIIEITAIVLLYSAFFLILYANYDSSAYPEKSYDETETNTLSIFYLGLALSIVCLTLTPFIPLYIFRRFADNWRWLIRCCTIGMHMLCLIIISILLWIDTVPSIIIACWIHPAAVVLLGIGLKIRSIVKRVQAELKTLDRSVKSLLNLELTGGLIEWSVIISCLIALIAPFSAAGCYALMIQWVTINPFRISLWIGPLIEIALFCSVYYITMNEIRKNEIWILRVMNIALQLSHILMVTGLQMIGTDTSIQLSFWTLGILILSLLLFAFIFTYSLILVRVVSRKIYPKEINLQEL